MTSNLNDNRSIHLVDLENLVGLPSALAHRGMRGVSNAPFIAMSRSYQQTFVAPGDLVWAATDVSRFLALSRHWPDNCFLYGFGRDGADRALLERFDPGASIRTCSTLHIASGDAIFAGVAEQFRRLGGKVVVHGRWHHVAWQLFRHSDGVDYVDDIDREAA